MNLTLSLIIRAFNRAKGPVRDAAGDIDYLGRRAQFFNGIGQTIGRTIGTMVGASAAGFVTLGLAVLRTASKFEQYENQLLRTEGSSARARAAFDWITGFSARTGKSLDESTASFLRLRDVGIDPTTGAMEVLGDVAAAKSKSMALALEALADAQTGQFERLREFGMRAAVKGDQVTFRFVKNGKDMVVSARNTQTEITRALMGIWGPQYAGEMARYANSWEGFQGRIRGTWTKIQLMIGRAGFFDKAKGLLNGWLGDLQRAERDGALQRWAVKTSTALSGLMTSVATILGSIDWPRTISGIGSVVSGLASFVGMIGGLQGILDLGVAGMIAHLTVTLAGLGTVLVTTGGALALTPWGWFVGAIAAVAGIAYIVIRNWGPISGFFRRLWSGIVSVFGPAFRVLKDLFLNFSPLGIVIKNWGPISNWLGGFWKGIKRWCAWGMDASRQLFFEFHPLGIIIKNWGPVSRFIAATWTAAKAYTSAAFRFLRAVIMEYTPVGDIVRNWGAVTGFFSTLWSGVKRLVSGALSAVIDYIRVYTPLGAVMRNWEPVAQFFASLWSRIKTSFANGIADLTGLMSRLSGSGILRMGGVLDFVARSEARTAAAAPRGPRAPPAAPSGRGALPGRAANGRVDVVIDHRNAPAGARTSARAQGPGVAATTRSRPAYRGATAGTR